MQLDVVNSENQKIGALDVRDDVFGGRVNTDLMWESVVHANAAQRQGPAGTPTLTVDIDLAVLMPLQYKIRLTNPLDALTFWFC